MRGADFVLDVRCCSVNPATLTALNSGDLVLSSWFFCLESERWG